MTYDLFLQGPEIYIPILVLSFVITTVGYGAFPLIFTKIAKRTITKKKYRCLCYGINFGVMVLFKILGSGGSGTPYILWTSIFTAVGLKKLEKKNLIEKGKTQPVTEIAEEMSGNIDSNGVNNILIPSVVEESKDIPTVRFCYKCGKQLPEGSRFCQFCGVKIEKSFLGLIVETDEEKKHSGISPKRIVSILAAVIITSCMIGGFVLYYQFDSAYESAREAIIQCRFKEAEELLMFPEVVLERDADLAECIRYGKYFEEGNFYFSYTMLRQKAEEGNVYADSLMEELTKIIYREAVTLYNQKDYYQAKKIFAEIQSHSDSKKYLLLCEAHTSWYWTDREYQSYMSILGFKDMKEVILADGSNAERYLIGTWKTSDGKYYFRMNADGNTNYSLPWLALSNSHYDIKDGIYYLYRESDTSTRKNVFKFTVVDETTMKVYCYKDGSTYTLYKQ